jgi:hypothetical protein
MRKQHLLRATLIVSTAAVMFFGFSLTEQGDELWRHAVKFGGLFAFLRACGLFTSWMMAALSAVSAVALFAGLTATGILQPATNDPASIYRAFELLTLAGILTFIALVLGVRKNAPK